MRPKKPSRKPVRREAKDGRRSRKAMRLVSNAATLALAIPLAWLAAGAAPHGFAPEKTYAGVVTKVVDGDTLYLEGVDTRIRLWGLDAPELGERGGNAAKRTLREIAHGERLRCKEIDIDRYQRIVGQCFLAGGEDVAALMIESGRATEYVRYSGGYYSAVKFASNR
ncbi:thermonuclease family protein [Hyphococcus sp.]|jgi:endonuclease YncB( thermonuclease family)|uniref:thermonuclease family protein n=1 Tax=Hyphococcus sp. TaxID=2038636 RepID=UPI003D14F243